jgi:hypothetical protein
MHKKSMWWLFLFLFGITIGGIQSLGWFTRQASAQTASSNPASPGQRVQAIEAQHWRSVVMHQ